MGIVTTFRCDACGAYKEKSNHWWLARMFPPSFQVFPLPPERVQMDLDESVYCSVECLQKKFSEFLGNALEGNLAKALSGEKP